MTYLLVLYFFLYRIAVLATIPLLWIALSHADRVHMRERARRLANSIIKTTESYVDPNNKYSKLLNYLSLRSKLYISRPLCVMTELLSGFAEGTEDLKPIMMIAEPYSAYRVETSKEVEMLNVANPILNKKESQISTFGRVDPQSHKNIANEIIDSSNDSNDEDDEDNEDTVSISTRDNKRTETKWNDGNDDQSDDRSDDETNEQSDELIDETDSESDYSKDSSEHNNHNYSQRRRGFRVKRVAPKSNTRPRIRLARRH
jgi:hypothetical protein